MLDLTKKLFMVCLCAGMFAFAACDEDETTEKGETGGDGKTLTFLFSPKDLGNTFFNPAKAGAKEAAKLLSEADNGYTVKVEEVSGANQGDPGSEPAVLDRGTDDERHHQAGGNQQEDAGNALAIGKLDPHVG